MHSGTSTPLPKSPSPSSSDVSLTPLMPRKRSRDDIPPQDTMVKISPSLTTIRRSELREDNAGESSTNSRPDKPEMAETELHKPGILNLPFTQGSPAPEDFNKDPRVPLEHKDWSELEARYHKAISEKQDEEKAIYDEYTKLSTTQDADKLGEEQ
ncbi:MAG: hypothetical protein M1814_001888 [Vezdaea aestivalis]|nr:MAG: hypothetical protein M1814_001888 [Vezdaea aestivalis]